MRLVLYQPDIPQNVGAAIRIAACFGAPLDIIEPCGFPLSEKKLQTEISRVAMDYGAMKPATIHPGWKTFSESPAREEGRLILLSTGGAIPLYDFNFHPSDLVMVGRESAGVPKEVSDHCEASLRIPIAAAARSLNVAVAGAVALSEARRQIGWET